MMLKVRQALPQDLEQMIALQTLAIERLCSSHYSEAQIEALVVTQRSVRSVSEMAWVAELEGQMVGFATLVRFRWMFWHRFGQIGGVYVHPDFVRRGIAARLVRRVEGFAIANHYQKLIVTSSLNAVPFYQALGYETAEQTKIPGTFGVWIDCVQLRKAYKQTVPESRPAYLQWLVTFLLLPLLIVVL